MDSTSESNAPALLLSPVDDFVSIACKFVSAVDSPPDKKELDGIYVEIIRSLGGLLYGNSDFPILCGFLFSKDKVPEELNTTGLGDSAHMDFGLKPEDDLSTWVHSQAHAFFRTRSTHPIFLARFLSIALKIPLAISSLPVDKFSPDSTPVFSFGFSDSGSSPKLAKDVNPSNSLFVVAKNFESSSNVQRVLPRPAPPPPPPPPPVSSPAPVPALPAPTVQPVAQEVIPSPAASPQTSPQTSGISVPPELAAKVQEYNHLHKLWKSYGSSPEVHVISKTALHAKLRFVLAEIEEMKARYGIGVPVSSRGPPQQQTNTPQMRARIPQSFAPPVPGTNWNLASGQVSSFPPTAAPHHHNQYFSTAAQPQMSAFTRPTFPSPSLPSASIPIPPVPERQPQRPSTVLATIKLEDEQEEEEEEEEVEIDEVQPTVPTSTTNSAPSAFARTNTYSGGQQRQRGGAGSRTTAGGSDSQASGSGVQLTLSGSRQDGGDESESETSSMANGDDEFINAPANQDQYRPYARIDFVDSEGRLPSKLPHTPPAYLLVKNYRPGEPFPKTNTCRLLVLDPTLGDILVMTCFLNSRPASQVLSLHKNGNHCYDFISYFVPEARFHGHKVEKGTSNSFTAQSFYFKVSGASKLRSLAINIMLTTKDGRKLFSEPFSVISRNPNGSSHKRKLSEELSDTENVSSQPQEDQCDEDLVDPSAPDSLSSVIRAPRPDDQCLSIPLYDAESGGVAAEIGSVQAMVSSKDQVGGVLNVGCPMTASVASEMFSQASESCVEDMCLALAVSKPNKNGISSPFQLSTSCFHTSSSHPSSPPSFVRLLEVADGQTQFTLFPPEMPSTAQTPTTTISESSPLSEGPVTTPAKEATTKIKQEETDDQQMADSSSEVEDMTPSGGQDGRIRNGLWCVFMVFSDGDYILRGRSGMFFLAQEEHNSDLLPSCPSPLGPGPLQSFLDQLFEIVGLQSSQSSKQEIVTNTRQSSRRQHHFSEDDESETNFGQRKKRKGAGTAPRQSSSRPGKHDETDEEWMMSDDERHSAQGEHRVRTRSQIKRRKTRKSGASDEDDGDAFEPTATSLPNSRRSARRSFPQTNQPNPSSNDPAADSLLLLLSQLTEGEQKNDGSEEMDVTNPQDQQQEQSFESSDLVETHSATAPHDTSLEDVAQEGEEQSSPDKAAFSNLPAPFQHLFPVPKDMFCSPPELSSTGGAEVGVEKSEQWVMAGSEPQTLEGQSAPPKIRLQLTLGDEIGVQSFKQGFIQTYREKLVIALTPTDPDLTITDWDCDVILEGEDNRPVPHVTVENRDQPKASRSSLFVHPISNLSLSDAKKKGFTKHNWFFCFPHDKPHDCLAYQNQSGVLSDPDFRFHTTSKGRKSFFLRFDFTLRLKLRGEVLPGELKASWRSPNFLVTSRKDQLTLKGAASRTKKALEILQQGATNPREAPAAHSEPSDPTVLQAKLSEVAPPTSQHQQNVTLELSPPSAAVSLEEPKNKSAVDVVMHQPDVPTMASPSPSQPRSLFQPHPQPHFPSRVLHPHEASPLSKPLQLTPSVPSPSPLPNVFTHAQRMADQQKMATAVAGYQQQQQQQQAVQQAMMAGRMWGNMPMVAFAPQQQKQYVMGSAAFPPTSSGRPQMPQQLTSVPPIGLGASPHPSVKQSFGVSGSPLPTTFSQQPSRGIASLQHSLAMPPGGPPLSSHSQHMVRTQAGFSHPLLMQQSHDISAQQIFAPQPRTLSVPPQAVSHPSLSLPNTVHQQLQQQANAPVAAAPFLFALPPSYQRPNGQM